MPDEPVSPADRAWLLEQELGPEIRRVFRRVADDRIGTGPIPASALVLYDPAFGPFHDNRDFLGFFTNEILHQDTCSPSTADGVEIVAWPAVDDRVPARNRMGLVEFLFATGTVGERHTATSWPDRPPHTNPAAEARAHRAVEAVVEDVFARWDDECTAVRIALAQLAAAFPREAGPEAGHRVRALADRLRNSTASDYLDFAAVMIHGDNAAMAAAVEHYTGWEADYDFRGTLPDVPVRSRALHLLDQMAEHEHIVLTALLRPEDRL
ncbi:hypothetical protein ACPA54_04785 [Uniformispora flossi]|uniref:hypothetical protein n=1 Tax=Uniformispora flossi TaxID=3390723 RepID=UPI003C2C06B0